MNLGDLLKAQYILYHHGGTEARSDVLNLCVSVSSWLLLHKSNDLLTP